MTRIRAREKGRSGHPIALGRRTTLLGRGVKSHGDGGRAATSCVSISRGLNGPNCETRESRTATAGRGGKRVAFRVLVFGQGRGRGCGQRATSGRAAISGSARHFGRFITSPITVVGGGLIAIIARSRNTQECAL